MKQIEHTVNFTRVYDFPKPKRTRKAITLIKDFSKKHFRAEPETVFIDTKVNELIWSRGREKPPRKVTLSFLVEDGKVTVYMKGKALEILEKKKKEEKKKKKAKAKPKEPKETKDSKGTAKKESEDEEAQKEAKKLKEKRLKEKSAEKAAIKRKTN